MVCKTHLRLLAEGTVTLGENDNRPLLQNLIQRRLDLMLVLIFPIIARRVRRLGRHIPDLRDAIILILVRPLIHHLIPLHHPSPRDALLPCGGGTRITSRRILCRERLLFLPRRDRDVFRCGVRNGSIVLFLQALDTLVSLLLFRDNVCSRPRGVLFLQGFEGALVESGVLCARGAVGDVVEDADGEEDGQARDLHSPAGGHGVCSVVPP